MVGAVTPATPPEQDRKALGRAARRKAPRSEHADWVPPTGRPDPVEQLREQNEDRVPWLVPIRHSRMQVSPFTFYRGAARIMAGDLANTPSSGLEVQLGGDAHCSNFGAYASPERRLVFDANDFDETLRGPWEWDLKRLATSFTVAAAHLGFAPAVARSATTEVVKSYRKAIASFARAGFLDVWYDTVDVEDIGAAGGLDPAELAKRLTRFEQKAKTRTSLQALGKLTERVDGTYRIRSDPPVLFPLRDLPAEYDASALEAVALDALASYRETLLDDRRWILDRYTPVDIGVKVVGVGSVGTRCLIILLLGRDEGDPLFLQAKEATASVLEEHLAPSPYANHGQRVVEGQRLAQAQSDIFLGWTEGLEGRHFYIRQLRDWKGSVEIDRATRRQLRFYGALCGHTLAHGHARSGDAVAISAYAGRGDILDEAVATFAEVYARQNLDDYEAFRQAIADGRLDAA